jgi:hypothetical protein
MAGLGVGDVVLAVDGSIYSPKTRTRTRTPTRT